VAVAVVMGTAGGTGSCGRPRATPAATAAARPAPVDAAEQARRDGIDVDAVRAAAAPPFVGPERRVAAPAPDPVPTYTGESPDAASDGTNYLVAWVDHRDPSVAGHIRASRVSPAGELLDVIGFAVSAGAVVSNPSVGFDGTNFLVVWGEYRGGAVDVVGNRVSRSGEVLDGTGFRIGDGASEYDSGPDLAFDGTNFLVVWNRASFPSAVRVSPDATVVGTAFPLSDQPGYSVEVSFDGTNHLAVWNGSAGGEAAVVGTRVGPDGTVLDPAGIAIVRGSSAGLAFDGTNHLVISATGDGYHGARVSPAGVVLDPTPIALPIPTGGVEPARPRVGFDGTNYQVVWYDSVTFFTGLYGIRVSPDGTVIDPEGVLLLEESTQTDLALASNGTDQLIVTESAAGYQASGISGYLVSPDLVLVGGLSVSTSANGQSLPAVAFDGTNYLVVWDDGRGATYGARVDRDGRILDGAGFRIHQGTRSTVAFDGTNYLVVSEGSYELIIGSLVSTDGTVLEPSEFSIAGELAFRPAVVFDGSNYLVAWFQYPYDCGCPDPQPFGIEAVRLDVKGRRIGSVLGPFTDTASPGVPPGLAFDGTNFLVAWADWRAGWDSPDIYGTRLRRDGVPVNPAPFPIATAAGTQTTPSVAFDGTRYLAVWSDTRSDPSSSDIYGARIRRSGAVLDPDGIAISTAPNPQATPEVTANGPFLVAWSDKRTGDYFNDEIYAARVRGNGTVVDGDGVPIATGSTREISPAVVRGPGNGFRVVYQRYAPEDPYATERVFMRAVRPA